MKIAGRVGDHGEGEGEKTTYMSSIISNDLYNLTDWAHSFAVDNGFDLLTATQDKFNKTSVKYGLDTRLEFAR